MLSPEHPTHLDEASMPIHAALDRAPFLWNSQEFEEIPLSFVTDVVTDEAMMKYKAINDDKEGLIASLSTFASPGSHIHIHCEMYFLHRKLKHKAISYDAAERES